MQQMFCLDASNAGFKELSREVSNHLSYSTGHTTKSLWLWPMEMISNSFCRGAKKRGGQVQIGSTCFWHRKRGGAESSTDARQTLKMPKVPQ